jgi:hypothetical protein
MESVISVLGGIVGLVGGVAGIYTFVRSELEARNRFLHVYLQIQEREDEVTALATLENRGSLAKKLDYAFLLISSEHENPIDTAKNLAARLNLNNIKFQYTNDLVKLKVDDPLYLSDCQAAIIPLPFFFDEQVQIGDESVAYRCTIDTDKLELPGAYSVRFFIFAENRLHRSTQDLFSIKSSQ